MNPAPVQLKSRSAPKALSCRFIGRVSLEPDFPRDPWRTVSGGGPLSPALPSGRFGAPSGAKWAKRRAASYRELRRSALGSQRN